MSAVHDATASAGWPANPGNGWLRGLTWDHPRGYAPLEELSRLDQSGEPCFGGPRKRVEWARQPLEGFESTPLDELADRYDLLVIDHPHLADAVAAGALHPLDDLIAAETLEGWRAATMGPSFNSYSHVGRQWAVPLDAAAQVRAIGPSGPKGACTRTWAQIAQIVRRDAVTLCLGGPHAFLTWTSIAIAHGARPATAPDGYMDRDTAIEALDLLFELHAATDREVAAGNPIQVLEQIVAGTAAPLCPLVFGYVNYSDATCRAAVTFLDAPEGPAGLGSILGGTGVAVSTRCTDTNSATDHIARLMSERVQCELVPAVGGQPSARAAWLAPSINQRWGHFYANTGATLAAAWVRPRRLGWVRFSDEASTVVREGLATDADPVALVDQVNDLYTHHLPPIN